MEIAHFLIACIAGVLNGRSGEEEEETSRLYNNLP